MAQDPLHHDIPWWILRHGHEDEKTKVFLYNWQNKKFLSADHESAIPPSDFPIDDAPEVVCNKEQPDHHCEWVLHEDDGQGAGFKVRALRRNLSCSLLPPSRPTTASTSCRLASPTRRRTLRPRRLTLLRPASTRPRMPAGRSRPAPLPLPARRRSEPLKATKVMVLAGANLWPRFNRRLLPIPREQIAGRPLG